MVLDSRRLHFTRPLAGSPSPSTKDSDPDTGIGGDGCDDKAPRRTVQVWRWSWINNIAQILMQFVAAGVLQHLAPASVNASSVGIGHTSMALYVQNQAKSLTLTLLGLPDSLCDIVSERLQLPENAS